MLVREDHSSKHLLFHGSRLGISVEMVSAGSHDAITGVELRLGNQKTTNNQKGEEVLVGYTAVQTSPCGTESYLSSDATEIQVREVKRPNCGG